MTHHADSPPVSTGARMSPADRAGWLGWCLYLLDDKQEFCHNFVGLAHFYVEANSGVLAGPPTRCPDERRLVCLTY
jgi:hypothetical protein